MKNWPSTIPQPPPRVEFGLRTIVPGAAPPLLPSRPPGESATRCGGGRGVDQERFGGWYNRENVPGTPTRRRWFQFRLWLILVLVTVIAMPFAAFSWVRQWSLNRTELLLLLMADKPACRISVVPAQ